MTTDAELQQMTTWRGEPLTPQQINDVSLGRECAPSTALAERIRPSRFHLLIDERPPTANGCRYRVYDMVEDTYRWFRVYASAEAFVDELHLRRLAYPGRYGFGCGVLPPEGRPKRVKKTKKATADPTPWMNAALGF